MKFIKWVRESKSKCKYTLDKLHCEVVASISFALNYPLKMGRFSDNDQSSNGKPLMYESPTSLDDLPAELIANVFKFSDIKAFKQLSLASKRFSKIGQTQLLRNIVVANHPDDLLALEGYEGFSNSTLISFKTFKRYIYYLYLKKELIKCFHFVEPKSNIEFFELQGLMKKFPNIEFLINNRGANHPISINPRTYLNPQFNGDRILDGYGCPLVNEISIEKNLIAGEVLYEYFQMFPNLQYLAIDNFYFFEKLVLGEEEKLKLRFLYISGENYSDIFDIIQLKYVKHLHLEHIGPKRNFLSKLERLEGLSLGAIDDKDITSLNSIPSDRIKYIDKYFRDRATDTKMLESISILQKAFRIISAPNFGGYPTFGTYDIRNDSSIDFCIKLQKLYDVRYRYNKVFRANAFSKFSLFVGEVNFQEFDEPVDCANSILSVFWQPNKSKNIDVQYF